LPAFPAPVIDAPLCARPSRRGRTTDQDQARAGVQPDHKDQALKPVDAARLLGVPQPKVSALVNYRLDGFSTEKLMEYIVTLRRDVEIVVRSFEHSQA
jgi:hypothetical protein